MFKVAVVGCGLIATYKFIPILRRLKDKVKIVGICDLNEAILKQVAAQFNVSNAYRNFPDLLSEQKPDIIMVCTPPRTHADLAITALQGGAHVLVEKPMAVSAADCDRMNEAAARYQRKLGVMHSQLFHPPFERVRSAVSSGQFGRFLGMRILLATGVGNMTSEPDHWAHKLPGGVVGETGPHAVYLSLAFLKNVREVQVRSVKHYPDYPWSIGEDIRFDLIADNGLSSVILDYGSNQTAAELDIICAEQLLRVDLQSRSVVRHNRSASDLSAFAVGWSVLGAACQQIGGLAVNAVRYAFSRDWDGHYVGINRFLDYVAGNAAYPATGQEGRQTVAVLEMIVQKLKEGLTTT